MVRDLPPDVVLDGDTDLARVGYGMSWWTGAKGDFYGWRISILLQLIPALIFASGVPFIPET